ncbi:DEAD/DEAH box helicase [Novacetimonas cocois]|uniref:DEAD-box ATP-dependent RNA helicase RhpA n=1 Tax=Novacetimonas cocois TaxID=1747507 RepID=A0A365Z203_9PROT|nr:DEAD/DEAH box helicase [Novacetimonas cocois]RBM09712.1 DNA helicase [Novacetimonas cocois]
MSAKKNTASARAGSAKAGQRAAATAGEIMPISDIEIVTPPETEDAPQPLFSELGLSAPIQKAIDEMGYRHPTPIQAQAIPYVLMGRDVLGVAQTGTGKTASFTLPMLEILSGSRARARMPRSLILEPTRELALQVAENFVNYGKYLKLNHALLIGGESMAEQKEVLNRGVDVLIATPGRLIDLFERGGLLLTQTKLLVIDEADRMLDMGFIPDIEKIVGMLSPLRQTLFFSATMAPEIRRLADMFLQNPKEITVSRPSSVASTIETGLVIVEEDDKRRALRKLLRDSDMQNAIIFCNRKRDVDILCKSLVKHGFSVGALHGDLPQSVRFSTLEAFKSGELKLLVCSDIAARGIDIGGLSHVFNFDLPFHAEDYVHRIGRTGRAGRTGHAYSLATPYEQALAEAIEKLTGKPIERLEVKGIDQAEWSDEPRPRGRKRTGKSTERTAAPAPRKASAESRPAESRPTESRPAESRKATPPRKAAITPREEHPATEGPQTGFGGDVPAFMLLPRRLAPVIPSAEDENRSD